MASSSGQQQSNRLAPFNPTCDHAQDIALHFLELGKEDVLFDLGCGDGRLLVKALQQSPVGLRCVGIEMDPKYVERAIQCIRSLAWPPQTIEQTRMIDIRLGDVMDEIITRSPANGEAPRDITALSLTEDATAIFLYLLPAGLRQVASHLQGIMDARSNVRIVSYMFALPGWKPSAVDRTTKGACPVYFYRRTREECPANM